MNNTTYIKLTLLLAIIISVPVQGKVKLPLLISDGMILQRETSLDIWGWADPNEKVVVQFQGKAYNIKAAKNGEWKVTLPPQNAGGPFTMKVNDIELKNILIGDVWLCSGQSNIELPIRRVLDLYHDEVKDARNPYIRQFRVPMKYNFQSEEKDLPGGESKIGLSQWKETTPENILDFTAAAYFFAKELYERYGVPIGFINNGVGGSPAEAWISEDALKNYPHYLEAARECANPAYVDSIRNADVLKSRLWQETLIKNDKGLSLWNKTDFDDSEWSSVSLPGYWAEKGIEQVIGTLWLRKNFDIPASIAGKSGVLRLGCIIDADSAFINGTFVGTITYQYPPRIYNIPAGLLKEGENNITVRVVSNSSKGGFVEEKPYKIIVGENEIDLTGDWKYNIGATMPPPGPQTTFQYKPMGLYNALIAPLKNYKLKGIVWYQGESNTNRAQEYKTLLPDLINDWRATWNNPQMPVIFAQLPNYMKAQQLPAESDWAELREAQRQALNLPYTGMAVTIDIGEWNDIHPLNKKTVGHRLALEAQRVAYGDNNVVSTGPIYESMQIEGNSIIITFSSTGSGIYTNLDLKGFAVKGKDGKYIWANATVLSSNKVKVWSEHVQDPIAVRYAWADNPEGANLRNKEGLPASPFQSMESGKLKIENEN